LICCWNVNQKKHKTKTSLLAGAFLFLLLLLLILLLLLLQRKEDPVSRNTITQDPKKKAKNRKGSALQNS
jgi:hypothetical protein